MTKNDIEVYFNDPRLEMTHLGRLFVRLVFYTTYGLMIAACITFLLSDIVWLFWVGALILIVLLDRIKHFKNGNYSLLRKLDKKVNIANYMTPMSFMMIEFAYERALISGGNFYLFLLKRLIEKKDIREGLVRMDLNIEEVENKIEEELNESLEIKKYRGTNEENKASLKEEIEKILSIAFEQAFLDDDGYIDPRDIFSALSFCESDGVLKILKFFDINPGDLRHAMIFGEYRYNLFRSYLPVNLGGFANKPYKIRHRIMNRAWTAKPTPILDQFSIDITDLARTGKVGLLIGHRDEYARMTDILSRPSRPNVLLIGDPGAGKESIINHLAFKISKDEVPAELFDKRLVMLQVGSLVAGAEMSELQKRLNNIVEEIVQAGNIILYIPELHNLVKTSGKTVLNAADILLPAIASSAFSVVGATNPQEYKRSLEPQVDFIKAFENINVQEILPEQATQLLVYEALILERQYRTKITFGAIKQAVLLASKYFRDKLLPASADDLLKEALSNAKDKGDKTLSSDDVIDVAQRRVSIPLRQAKQVEAEKLLNMEALIHERLVDQEEAVKAVSRSLREYRSGLSRKGGPIASFLFVGPTGVGKTELSKILASIQFGSKNAMTRFDMSEYQDKQSISRFIGSSDGSMSGMLTEAILKNPYSLILLDEFEKAHPDILNLFLQVFDDGRLTDNMGRTVNFENTVIIATSNAHSNFIKEEIDKGSAMSSIAETLKKKLTEYFRPELINRFSGIIVFKSLSESDIFAVTKILLKEFTNDIKTSHRIEISFSDEVVAKIAEWGYDPAFGARPLRGVISERIRGVLAEKILKKEIDRGSNIKVELDGEELKYII